MRAVVERTVCRRRQPRDQPQHQQDGDELPTQRHHSEINDAQRHVQHVHAGQCKKGRRKLRHELCDVDEFGARFMSRNSGKHGQRQAFRDQVAPLLAVQHDERGSADHGGQQPQRLPLRIVLHRRPDRQHHGQRTGEQEGGHDRGVDDTRRVERGRPARCRDAPVTVGIQQRSERQRIGHQEQPHPDLLRIRSKQRRLVYRRDVTRNHGISHAPGLLVNLVSFSCNCGS